MYHFFGKLLTTAALVMNFASAQTEYGVVQLPSSLAEAGTKVLGVHNVNPTTKAYLGFSEGPAVDSSGNLFFTEFDPSTNLKSTIWKVTPGGQASVFYYSTEGSNGMEFDPEWHLVAAQVEALMRFNADGSHTILAASGNGVDLKRINDLSIGTGGAMYFTNHATGNNVFFRSVDGKIKTLTGFTTPNGVEWIEEKKIVFVNFALPAGKVMKYKVNDDMSLSGGVEFASMNMPDGITADEQGNLYVASYREGAISVFDSTGKTLGKITLTGANPSDKDQTGNTSNCSFGGEGNRTLYIAGDGGAYKVQLKVAGRRRPVSVSLLPRNHRWLAPLHTRYPAPTMVNSVGRILSPANGGTLAPGMLYFQR